MRILHVNDVSSVASGFVRASGGRDSLIQPTLRRLADGNSISLVRLAARRLGDARRIRGDFLSRGFSNLHVHYATFAHLAEIAGLSYSLHLHGGDLLLDLNRRVRGWLVRAAIERATAVAVSTPNLMELAVSLRPDTKYIPNPVEVPQLPRSSSRATGPYGIMLSKMNPLKGWDRQVALMRVLGATVPNLRFWFVRDGRLPEAYRNRVAAELQSLGGNPTPLLSRQEFLSLVAAADFAIGQMEVGALGMAELESMALGVPTVADASAHAGGGRDIGVIDPSEAPAILRDLATTGLGPYGDGVRRAQAYVETVHDPARCLGLLERLLT